MKKKIAELIGIVLKELSASNHRSLKKHLSEMKKLAQGLPVNIQQDVQNFIQQVDFENDYDFRRLITKEIVQSANKLIKDLGYKVPRETK